MDSSPGYSTMPIEKQQEELEPRKNGVSTVQIVAESVIEVGEYNSRTEKTQ